MPRNNRLKDRDEKRDEIVFAARDLFIEIGYDATPVNRIAERADIATNTIYWYFRDKDALLIAVLDAVVAEAWAEYETIARRPIPEQLKWIVERLDQVSRLVTAVHARIAVSSELDKWHDRFHRAAEGAFRQTLVRVGVDEAVLDAEVKVVVFAIEGMLTHGLRDAEKRAICDALAARWVTGGSANSMAR